MAVELEEGTRCPTISKGPVPPQGERAGHLD